MTIVLYLIIQTVVFSVAAAFYIYGNYQSNDYVVSRKRDLFENISIAILLIFVADIFAMFIFWIITSGRAYDT